MPRERKKRGKDILSKKKRVAAREKMMAEREAITAERDHGAALPLKIHDKDSHFYPDFLCLSQNFHGKSVLPPSSKVQDRHKEQLS